MAHSVGVLVLCLRVVSFCVHYRIDLPELIHVYTGYSYWSAFYFKYDIVSNNTLIMRSDYMIVS